MLKANLLVISGVDQGARFELDDGEVSIGRGFRNRWRILDTEMSRNHAIIRFEDGGYVLADRNSSNGTYLNGNPVKTHRLVSGDQITVGRTSLLYSEVSESRPQVQVELISAHADDASQIVGSVGHDAGRKLLERSVTAPKDQTAQSLANLKLLYRISEETVSSALSMDQLLQRILDTTIQAVGAERGCMLVANPKTGQLEPRAVSQSGSGTMTTRMPVSRSIVDYVLKNGQGVRTSDARADSRFASAISVRQENIREAMCVPMPGRYELMGVIYVDTTSPFAQNESTKFDDEELSLLAAIGRQAALAVEDHRFQDAFVKAERLAAVGQTIAILSHHIKNILQGVKGGSYLIDMGLKKHDESLIGQGWKIVEKNQDRIYHLVMDMLTFSTERQPKLEMASVNEVARDVFELMQVAAQERNIVLQYAPNLDVPPSMFDIEGLHRAVLNILTNALDAVDGQDKGVIEISTGISSDGTEVWIDIADNGPGIPSEQLAAIFNIFESTKGARGTGLGLAVSQKIMREHGGDILVESELNRGSRFRLVWPAMDEEQRASRQK